MAQESRKLSKMMILDEPNSMAKWWPKCTNEKEDDAHALPLCLTLGAARTTYARLLFFVRQFVWQKCPDGNFARV